MSFEVVMHEALLEQLSALPERDRRQIAKKIQLLKLNPYRFKALQSRQFSKVFRIRLNLLGKEMRLVYVVIEPRIILVCLLERSRNYKDVERYLTRIG